MSAVAEYGEYDKAFAILKEYYGGMLEMGATDVLGRLRPFLDEKRVEDRRIP